MGLWILVLSRKMFNYVKLCTLSILRSIASYQTLGWAERSSTKSGRNLLIPSEFPRAIYEPMIMAPLSQISQATKEQY